MRSLRTRLQDKSPADRGFERAAWAGWPDLAELRRSRKISVNDIAALTKIPVGYLTAIEKGEFEKLPGGLYTTSYIRQYARAIDYPEQDLLELWRAKVAASSEPQCGPQGDTPRQSSPLRFFRKLIGLVS